MKYFKRITITKAVLFVITLALLLAYLFLVDPTSGGLLVLLVPIILSWILLFMTVSLIVEYIFKNYRKSVAIFISATVSSAVLFFLLLSGIGTISLIDIFLTTALVVLVAFYISRLWK